MVTRALAASCAAAALRPLGAMVERAEKRTQDRSWEDVPDQAAIGGRLVDRLLCLGCVLRGSVEVK